MELINKLVAIADGFRSSRGTTKQYTLDEMAVLAAEKVGGGSDATFDCVASGILPEIAKGTAMGDFTFNFEISATGALQEE